VVAALNKLCREEMKPPTIVEFNPQYAPRIKHIRNAVFTFEQGIDERLDFEGNDPDAIHVLVGLENEFVKKI
jgi:hypothetical protein